MSVLVAQGAGVRLRRRWLFRDLDVTVEPGELVAVVGPPGSGRTTALLALAGRFRLSAGKVSVHGRASLGYVPDVEAPEPVFTVAEHVRERLALLGRSRGEAPSVDLRGLDAATQGRDLSPYEKQVLGLVLAGLSGPAVIALDGFEDGLDTRERASLGRMLTELAGSGTAVLLTSRELPAGLDATQIRLGATQTSPDATHTSPDATQTSPDATQTKLGGSDESGESDKMDGEER
jgi:ABC-2 type transport system ATP-binding protein